jgi:type IV pilus assembly protein PilA
MLRLRQRGFSIIELLIVVAIILIIAAIAIPNLLRARMSANEASAASSVRQIKTAQTAYHNLYVTTGYAPTLGSLGCAGPCPNPPTPAQSGFLDDSLAHASAGTGRSGYYFAATGIATAGAFNDDFVVGAAPVDAGRTGNRDFCSTSEAVIRTRPSMAGAPVITIGGCLAFPDVL